MFSDVHLRNGQDNESLVNAIIEKFEELFNKKDLNIQFIVFLGDLFESRENQSFNTLKYGRILLERISQFGCPFYIFRGNHDSVGYLDEESYISVLYGDLLQNTDITLSIQSVTVNNINFYFLPYFSEEVNYEDYLEKIIIKEGKNILFTHIGINPSKSSSIETLWKKSVNINLFNRFDKVFSGHFHDELEFGNISYIGATNTQSFGEDYLTKGIKFLNFETLKTINYPINFKNHIRLELNLKEEKDNELIIEKIKNFKIDNINNHLEVLVIGDLRDLQPVKDYCKKEGIKFKDNLSDEFIGKYSEKMLLKVENTDNDIINSFEVFCEENNYSEILKFNNDILND